MLLVPGFGGFKEPGHTGKFGTGDPFDGQLVSWDRQVIIATRVHLRHYHWLQRLHIKDLIVTVAFSFRNSLLQLDSFSFRRQGSGGAARFATA